MVYKSQLDFKHRCPSGCDTSKLLSDDLKNELYYDGFQKMLYHYSHQEKPVHNVYWFFFFGAEEDLNRAAARSAVSNQPGGLLLSPRFPTCRNVYREADCPLSFLLYTAVSL